MYVLCVNVFKQTQWVLLDLGFYERPNAAGEHNPSIYLVFDIFNNIAGILSPKSISTYINMSCASLCACISFLNWKFKTNSVHLCIQHQPAAAAEVAVRPCGFGWVTVLLCGILLLLSLCCEEHQYIYRKQMFVFMALKTAYGQRYRRAWGWTITMNTALNS